MEHRLIRNETLNFCTLFDSNYADRALLMYKSLSSCCDYFHLYIFLFDEKAFQIFTDLKLKNVTLITLKEFEDEDLLKIKPTRSKVEYLWTCSSSTILYVLEKYNVSSCTYIDADLFFYSNPRVLIEELQGDLSILITSHRYPPTCDQTELHGKYNVQFVTFKHNEKGLKALRWWRERCLEWCYAKPEDGKIGDQKYLDDWTERFEGVHVLENLGGGVGPWNMVQYNLEKEDNNLIIIERNTQKKAKLVFFHFHGLEFFKKKVDLSSVYPLANDFKNLLYIPYVREILKIRTGILEKYKIQFYNKYQKKNPIKEFIRIGLRILRGQYKVYNVKLFK